MFETPLAVVGTIVTDPKRRMVGGQEVMKFRVASNSRRRGADGNWEPGNSLFITVNCWGRLVTGVGAALGKGSPVIVLGSVYTSEYQDRDGVRRSAVEMRASAVGPDVSRAIVRVEKLGHSATGTAPGGDATTPAEAGSEPAAGEGDPPAPAVADGARPPAGPGPASAA
ncbi:single-stranded DNA-binding protein [Mycobacterium sp. SM1]|uniref:single-stranded DNA-binding protein n=1 Tax=Mycobacterium sp. SM1 TaxID=2816243 RepID=UPI001BCCADF9|nr:single-stranded DNA-binding protein [Mycobacterium sp. SM1]MBS4727225.1 single-stranded DNA-binding protein [Mycobacterium sp. SM1]